MKALILLFLFISCLFSTPDAKNSGNATQDFPWSKSVKSYTKTLLKLFSAIDATHHSDVSSVLDFAKWISELGYLNKTLI